MTAQYWVNIHLGSGMSDSTRPYLNQFYLLISECLWHSHENNFIQSAQGTLLNDFESFTFELLPHPPGGNEILCAMCMCMCINVCAELRSVFHIYPGILKTSLSFIYASTAEQNYTKNGQEFGPIPANCNMFRWDFTSVIPRCVWDNASFYHRRITLIRIDRIESGLWKVNQVHCLLYEKEW